jgi:RNA polymerase sigma-70 factor (ECF subfamily)
VTQVDALPAAADETELERPLRPDELRADFGAHFEANYQRLVAQLYAITLDPGQAHDAVQDAYSRAWRRWDTVGATSDPSAWIRSVAVRSTIRSWRNMFTRIGIGRPRPMEWDVEPRTAAMLTALHRLPIPERRAIVLSYMAGVSAPEIAAIDETSLGSVQARLSRGRRLMTVSLADDLPVVLGMISGGGGGDYDEEYR